MTMIMVVASGLGPMVLADFLVDIDTKSSDCDHSNNEY